MAGMRRVVLGLVVLLAVAFAADTDLTGGFAGTWKNQTTGDSGVLRFTLKNTAGNWTAEAGITYQGAELVGTTQSLKVENGKLELVYDCNVQGSNVRVVQRGQWNGTEFSGTFSGMLVDSGELVGGGPWSAKRK
jgi:hypothetical protein